MRRKRPRTTIVLAVGCLFWFSAVAQAQEGDRSDSPGSSASETETATEVGALSGLIHQLQEQVQTLNLQVRDLRDQQQRSIEEAKALRHELDLAKMQLPSAQTGPTNPYSPPPAQVPPEQLAPPASLASPQGATDQDRIAALEENQEVLDAKINDQYQTKVESGSKYRLRLSGIVLLNMYDNRGSVDNQDFPEVSESASDNPFAVSPSSFGGTLRQSQIRLQAFGPDLAGAKTSADIQFDFAGGFPDTWNGVATGLVRLRTGTIRLDWANTSIIAGQDHLFFAPLSPTSLASMAQPPLSYAGNLWAWMPQVRVEHRVHLSDVSNVVLEAGILDSLTGDFPVPGDDRDPSWGEESGQPAYAARVSWSHRVFGQNLTLGAGGYYARQNWGFNRDVDGWAGTTDVTLPLGKLFEFTGEFYRGRAVAGLGGGIGQSVLLNGSFVAPATTFRGLDSMGGWGQLKFKPMPKLEFNAALGIDNPFADEMRQYEVNTIYSDSYSRNLSPFVNFIYQVRSDILFSTEYQRLQTSVLDGGSNSANHIALSLGYIF